MSGDPAFEAGRLTGFILFPVLLIVGGVFLGRHLGRKKNPPAFVAWPVIVAVILAAIAVLAPRPARGAEIEIEVAHG